MDHETRPRAADPEDRLAWMKSLAEKARVRGLEAWLELLHDIETWSQAPDLAITQAELAVLTRLGANFEVAAEDGFTTRLRSPRYRHKPSGIILRLIPGAELPALRREGEDPSEQQAPGRLSAFLIGEAPVSQAEWDAIGGEDDRRFQGAERPIESVSYHDIQDWLGRSQTPFRLPFESEWELACRAGSQSIYFFGDDPSQLGDYAWYRENCAQTQALRRKKPNAFGLFDTHGNVWEWCSDGWQDEPVDPRISRDASLSLHFTEGRVYRGGSWFNSARSCTSDSRSWAAPDKRADTIGFRVACSIPEPDPPLSASRASSPGSSAGS